MPEIDIKMKINFFHRERRPNGNISSGSLETRMVHHQFEALDTLYAALNLNYLTIKKFGFNVRPTEKTVTQVIFPIVNRFTNTKMSFAVRRHLQNDTEGLMILHAVDSAFDFASQRMFGIQWTRDWLMTDLDYFEEMKKYDWKSFERVYIQAKYYLETLLSLDSLDPISSPTLIKSASEKASENNFGGERQ